MFDLEAELIEDSDDRMVDQVIKGAWMVVEGRCGWHQNRARFRRLDHQTKMTEVKRSFANNQHQWASLFQADIGSASDELVVGAIGNSGKSPHAARRYNHSIYQVRPTRDGGAYVRVVMHDIGERSDGVGIAVQLVSDGVARGIAEHEVGLNILATLEQLQESNPIMGTR